MTIFLTDPKKYDGGELILNVDGREQAVKLKQGEAICYPSSIIHRVNKVVSGE
ncbi:MAG: 2OG-Fe(II) oxygenase, partial [Flavobacteriales bacterium]|nr:2OG-Fe(II) oxygenase [Flavobacteriales bacterium]